MSPVFDEQDQLDKMEVGLLEGETVIAVYDGGDTGFIGLTGRRVVVQDNTFDGGRSALTSLPYRRIDAVSFVSDTSESGKFTFSPSVGISAGGKVYEIRLSDQDKARHVHEVVLRSMGGFVG